MSGITNNYVSQVPSTFGTNYNTANNSQVTTTSAPNPFQSGDKYSVESTSNSFDQAMAKLTGKNVFSAQSAPQTQNSSTPPIPANVSQEEMNWALLLEQKVAGGYQPNAQETQAYQAIAAKLSNSATNPSAQSAQAPASGATQEEINWALSIEEKVKGGYTPNVQETQAYQNIAAKLAASKSGGAATTQQATAPAGASQEEINWALALEQKVKTGYTPNAQETQAYQNIAAKLAAGKSAATAPTQQTAAPAGASQEEINWALALEQKVKTGYTPNAQETQAYQAIAAKLSASKTGATAPAQQTANAGLPSGVSQEEVNWALSIEEKVKTGYQPNAEETAKYQAIAAKLASGATPSAQATAQPISQDEVNWALALEQKVKTGYTPNAEETAKYQDIAHRLQTQSASGNAPTAGNATGKDWATWSQPFSVPKTLFQTTPRIVQVPASLRSASPSLPTYTSVNAGPSLTTGAQGTNQPVSQNEIEWALNIEKKVKTGYNPTNSELYQYKNIADRLQASHGQQTQAPQQTQQTTTPPASAQPKVSIAERMKNAWNALTK